MKLAILYEDGDIWIEMSPEEFTKLLVEKAGPGAENAMKEIINEIKLRSIGS